MTTVEERRKMALDRMVMDYPVVVLAPLKAKKKPAPPDTSQQR